MPDIAESGFKLVSARGWSKMEGSGTLIASIVWHEWRKALAIAMSLSLGLLVGCNTTDPNQGGFLGGLGGLASGNYERGTQKKREALQDDQDKQIALKRKADRLRAKNAAVSEDLARTESQLRAIEVDLGTLNDRLAKAKTKTNVERNRLAALRKEIDELAGDIDRERLTFSDDSGTRRVKELERRKRELQEQIEQFLLAS